VRFDSAREAGLTESKVDQIMDGYEQVLPPAETAALQLTDAIIGDPRSLSEPAKQALRANYSDAEIVEIALGVGMFMGMSKVLINLGLEPEDMPLTIVPTPGTQ
jgi:alkylhydroperoxidase family enzyme